MAETWKKLILEGDAAEFLKLEETLASDHTWSGITCDGVAGENLVLPDLVYLKSDGKWWKADADAAATTEGILALATAAINAAASGVLLLFGFFRDDTWNFTVGAPQFVSPTAGALTETKPSTTGQQIRRAGHGLTADILFFNPESTLLEAA